MRAVHVAAIAGIVGLTSVHAGPVDVQPLVEALRPSVKTLARPVYVYHYVTRSRMTLAVDGYLAPTHLAVTPFLEQKIARFWDVNVPVRPFATASGLYAGVDPVSSRTFGGVGDGWAIVQIVLPAGFTFIDVRRPESPLDAGRFPAAVREELARHGCDAEFAEPLVTGLESAGCRAAATILLRALDVGGIVQSFPRQAFVECVVPRPAGFILLQSKAFGAGVTLMTKETRDDEAQNDRRIIRDLFVRAVRAGSERIAPWPELAGTAVPVDVPRWMREHVFGCGTHPEDQLLDSSA